MKDKDVQSLVDSVLDMLHWDRKHFSTRMASNYQYILILRLINGRIDGRIFHSKNGGIRCAF